MMMRFLYFVKNVSTKWNDLENVLIFKKIKVEIEKRGWAELLGEGWIEISEGGNRYIIPSTIILLFNQ